MYRNVHLLLCLLLFSSGNSFAAGDPAQELMALYQKANRLFYLSEPTEQTDSIALAGFSQVILLQEKRKTMDTLLFQAYLKKGILLDVRKDFPSALTAYLKALSVHRLNKSWSDSLAYALYVYTGSVYYNLNQFDSANHFLAAAEALSKKYPGVPEKERLYNVWGALFYESGNYRQSSNFFMQALAIIKNKQPFDKISAINFENNIAASFYRQEQYDRSIALYKKLLTYGLFTNQLWLNMGKSYLAMGEYRQALACFKKVNPDEAPGVENETALAQLMLNDTHAAAAALDRFVHRAQRKLPHAKNIDAGINFFYRAQLQSRQDQFAAALASLQQAIIIFSGRFTNSDPYSNPEGFTGSFTSYKLLEALKFKAELFHQYYSGSRQQPYLLASLAAYQSAISLLRYIEKSYDTDDARLLLKKNSKAVYDGAFQVCMQLHRLHSQEQYLEQAFLIAEKSKASVIAQQLKEHQLKRIKGIDPALLQQERQLKYDIARLNVKLDQMEGAAASAAIAQEKMNYEIRLSRLQQTMERNNAYHALKYEDAYPGWQQLQEATGNHKVLVSFYAGAENLHAFLISRHSFRHVQLDSLERIRQLAKKWTNALQSAVPGRRFNHQTTGLQLYRQLVQPIRLLTAGMEEWIIIPDDVLHFLPFESLPDGKGRPLLESVTISYHFSSQFMLPPPAKNTRDAAYKVLAIAPFSRQGMAESGYPNLARLPASLTEIEGLPGLQFTDVQATKENLLHHLNKYPVVHIVTHAVADLNNSGQSFLAFHPFRDSMEDNKLYTEELYGLNMDATELVILSACETGQGKLINGEGVMSLSRGFAYAGCASIINSLWKADDKAASIIMKKFHHYLQKGLSKSEALRQAKLHYFHSNALHKTPDKWANFILIGDTEGWMQRSPMSLSWLILIGLAFAAIPYFLCLPVLNSSILRSAPDKSSTLAA